MNPVIRSIILLPGLVLIVIPFLLVFITTVLFHEPLMAPGILPLIVSLIFFLLGFLLMGVTIRLFASQGHGTLAPWDPPKHLILTGPYRYVRNPMIIGVLLVLLAESLLFQSQLLVLWMIIFFLGNIMYIPLVEEPRLRERFGSEYDTYTKEVPRWIPRRSPWENHHR